MAMNHLLCGLAAAMLLTTAPKVLCGTIVGHVRSSDEGEPLAGVRILLQGTVLGTNSDVHGEFRLPAVPAGTYSMMFSLIGFHRGIVPAVIVHDTGETVVDIALTPSPIQTDPIVVTANKREQSLDQVPTSISIVDALAIEQRNARSIDDALRYIPGVNITGTQVNIRGFSGYSLGAGSRVLMLLDGIPFIAGDTGELNFESIPMGEVERIEVVKGASSALYGSNALGGVINLITKPIPEGEETTVRMYGGLYTDFPVQEWKWSDRNRYFNGQSISHTYREGNLGLSMFFSQQGDDGYRQNDYRHRYSMLVRMKEGSTSSSSLGINVGLVHQNAGQFLFWRNIDSALITPRRHETDNETSTRYFVSGLYNLVASDHLQYGVKVLWYHNEWGVEQTGQTSRTGSLADDLRLEVLSTILPSPLHTMTVGVTGSIDRIGGDIFEGQTLGGFAVYAQDEFKATELVELTAGVRFDFQSVGLTSDGGQLNPKLGLVYHPVSDVSLRASFSHGFRVPSLPEAFVQAGSTGVIAVPNKDLRPEKSSSYEIGMAWKPAEESAVDIAFFRSDIDNMIEPGLIVAGSDLQVQWRNVTRAQVQGLEASVQAGLFDGALIANIGYTYSHPWDLTLDRMLKYRPRHVLYCSGRTKLQWFTAGIDFRYVSKIEEIDDELVLAGVIPDGDQRVPIYVTDVRVGAEVPIAGIPLSITASVNNLFQHRYVELIGNIMPPRNYVLVVQARL